jgi:cell division protein FtsW (lipid II flippase)
MKLDDYRSDWRANGANARGDAEEVKHVINSMMRSHRRRRVVLTICAVNTAIVFLFIATMLVRGVSSWTEILPALAAQTILAAALGWLIRRHQQRRRALELDASPIREAAETGLRSVNGEIRDARLLLALACVVTPLFAMAVYQLISSGKMDARAAFSFATLYGAVLAVNAVVMWGRHRRTLIPRRKRMTQILASLREEKA